MKCGMMTKGVGDPVQIAKGIMVNHFGSIITCDPIRLPPDGYLDIDPEKDWDFCDGDCRTVRELWKNTRLPGKRKKTGTIGGQSCGKEEI